MGIGSTNFFLNGAVLQKKTYHNNTAVTNIFGMNLQKEQDTINQTVLF